MFLTRVPWKVEVCSLACWYIEIASTPELVPCFLSELVDFTIF